MIAAEILDCTCLSMKFMIMKRYFVSLRFLFVVKVCLFFCILKVKVEIRMDLKLQLVECQVCEYTSSQAFEIDYRCSGKKRRHIAYRFYELLKGLSNVEVLIISNDAFEVYCLLL